jgi:hypothetical protein
MSASYLRSLNNVFQLLYLFIVPAFSFSAALFQSGLIPMDCTSIRKFYFLFRFKSPASDIGTHCCNGDLVCCKHIDLPVPESPY